MIYQIKITLNQAKPPIWRRLEVLPETTLEDMHKIIQSSMGWMNAHLHQFLIYGEYYAPPSEWNDFGVSYKGIKLKDVISAEGEKIEYEYDFGDSWMHSVKIEKIKEKEKGINYPRCIKGKRACPPEDCGGVWGYMELVEIMKDKKHKQYENMLNWLGEELDSETFDIDKVNERLKAKNYGVYSFF